MFESIPWTCVSPEFKDYVWATTESYKPLDAFEIVGVFFCDSLDLYYDSCHVIKHES